MNKMAGIVTLAWVLAASTQAELAVRGLSCEHMPKPMGIETAQPRFSWKLEADESGQAQTACRILVADGPKTLAEDQGNLWDSGWVYGGSGRLVPYSGQPLESLQNIWWKVQVKDRDGKRSAWSAPAQFATGLLPGDAPHGSWIFNPSSN